jgi:AcrR family transcriptional regulator
MPPIQPPPTSSAVSRVRKPQERGLRSAQKLLEAAASLFVEKGFDETSIDEIVLLAGSAKGTFYHHYESKQALLIALRQRVKDQYQADMDAVLAKDASDDLSRRLDTWVSAAFDAYINIGPLHEIVYGNYPESRWTSSDMRFMADFVALLKEGHEKKLWTVPTPHLTATFIYRGMLGAIDDLVLAGKPLTSVKRNMVALARHTVGL